MERENGNAIKGIFQSLQAIVKSLQVIKAYRRRAEKGATNGTFHRYKQLWGKDRQVQGGTDLRGYQMEQWLRATGNRPDGMTIFGLSWSESQISLSSESSETRAETAETA